MVAACEEFRLFAIPSAMLSCVSDALPNSSSKLRDHDNHDQNPSSDEILLDLLRRSNDIMFRPMWQRLLLLVFIPTIHRTTTQITRRFLH